MVKKTPRECGDCTACCRGWLRLQVEETAIGPGHPCPHIHNPGCGIYHRRPTTCAKFNCAWLINDLDYPNWMRPDNARVILKYVDLVSSVSAICAIPTGTKVSPRALNFLRQLSNQHSLPVLHFQRTKVNGHYQPQVAVTAFGPAGMESVFQQIQAKIEEVEQMGSGTTKRATRNHSGD